MHKTIPTKYLMLCGVAAATIFPLVTLVQALTREGFNLAIHPLSMLSLGDLGWIQIANFIVAGVLFMAFATGLRRVLKAKSRGAVWGPRLFGFYGTVLVAAGVFTVDPMLGFPPGTPDGMPETLSWHAIVHNVTFIIAFLGLIVAQFVFVRRFASMKQWKFAVYSFVNGVATPMLIVASEAAEDVTGYILYGTGVLVNIWIISLSLKLLAESDGRHKA